MLATWQCFTTTTVVATALRRKRAVCNCHNVQLYRSMTTDKPIRTDRNLAFTASALLLLTIALPVFSVAFYRKRKRHNLLKNYGEANLYQTPFVDTSTGSLVRHKGHWFPAASFPSIRHFDLIRNFKLIDDDILVVSFPKSGTTWVQQIVWLIVSEMNSRDDRRNIEQRFPYLEYVYPGLNDIAKMTDDPRLIKSHLPYHCLPKAVEAGRAKVIYISRNAKDVSVSYYHFYRMLTMVKYRGNFADFWQLFSSGHVAYGPWTDHVGEFWDKRHDRNVLFLFYEDLHQRPEQMVAKIAEFLGYSLSPETISAIVQQTRFSAMKNDVSVNYSWWDELGLRQNSESQFMRKGIVGDWRNYFSADMETEMFDCCVEPLQRRGLTFTDRTQ